MNEFMFLRLIISFKNKNTGRWETEPSRLTLNYIYDLTMQSYLFIALHILQTVQPENHEEPGAFFLD